MAQRPDRISVLHVDDDQQFLETAAVVLKRESDRISVTTAQHPADGVDLLHAEGFDCLVSDFDMGETNGIEFLETVRETSPDLPFILFTGKGSEEIAAEAISAGATDYIQKKGGTSQYTVLANRIENSVEQYRAKQQSERANRRRRRTLEHIVDGFTEMDGDLVITDVNTRAANLVGRSREVVVGTRYRDLMTDDAPGVFLDTYESVLESGEPQSVEARSDIQSGRWVKERVFPARDGDGIFVYSRNITERKRREQLQRIIIESSSQLIDADEPEIDDQITETLRRIGEFEGADRSYVFQIYDDNERMDNTHEWCAPGVASQMPELQNLSTAAFSWYIPKIEAFETVTVPRASELPPEATHLQQTLESGDIESIVTIPLTRGGSLLGFIGFDWTEEQEPWSQETIALLEISGNIIANALARKETIVGRKERERTLSELHDTARELGRADDPGAVYELLVDTAAQVFDLEYAAVDVERDGYLVQVAHLDSDVEEYHQRSAIAEEETLAARAYNRGETLVIDDVPAADIGPDESPFWSNLTVPIGEFGTFQTVSTTRGAFDDQDREFAELLADHARVKLTQLQNEARLKEQTAELEAKNERLEDFAALVSHDLRNPLNALQLSIEMAEQTGETEHFSRAEQAANRMERLLEDMLTLARGEETVSDREPVSLRALGEDAWQTVETAGQTLTVETDATVEADRTRLWRLLENLFNNAVEHGSRIPPSAAKDHDAENTLAHDTSSLEVTLGSFDGGFYVADNGDGIPADERDSVFDPGYSTAADGTGFGLAIVDDVADTHGWSVRVTDSEDGGARFEILTT